MHGGCGQKSEHCDALMLDIHTYINIYLYKYIYIRI